MEEKNKTEIEREYVIPLRSKCRHVARYKKTNKAVRTLKEFLVKHMKIRDRDLNKVKLDVRLNDYLWENGIKNPPCKVKVKAIKKEEIVYVSLLELTDKLEKKQKRIDKREEKAKKNEKAPVLEKKEEVKTPEEEKEKEEEKEMKETLKESEREIEKNMHKEHKHEASGVHREKTKQMKKILKQ